MSNWSWRLDPTPPLFFPTSLSDFHLSSTLHIALKVAFLDYWWCKSQASKASQSVSDGLWFIFPSESKIKNGSINKHHQSFSSTVWPMSTDGLFKAALVFCLQIESLLESHSWISLAGQSGKHGGMPPAPYAQKNCADGWDLSLLVRRFSCVHVFSGVTPPLPPQPGSQKIILHICHQWRRQRIL